MKKNMLYPFVYFFLTLLLIGCGFRPQGEVQLAPPLHRMYLQDPDPYGVLARNLQTSLKMSKVQLVSSPQDADTILVIMQNYNTQRFLGVSGTQQTRQYELKVTVVFEITDAKGLTLLSPQTLSEARNITMQSNQILGSSNEANLLYQQMRRSLAYAIINRIASKEVTALVNEGFNPKAAPKTQQRANQS